LRRPLYIEFESYLRDFDYRFLLSLELALEGYDVIFGNVKFLPPFSTYGPAGSIYLSKDAMPEKTDTFRARKNRGVKNIVLDEEGLSVFQQPDKFAHYRFSHGILPFVHKIVIGTEYEGQVLDEIYDVKSKLIKLINPRFTINNKYKLYTEQAKQIIQKYGSFVFIPLSIYIRHNLGEELRNQQINAMQNGITNNQSQKQGRGEFIRFYESYKENNLKLLQHVRMLCLEHPTVSFVVRPHPSDISSDGSAYLTKIPDNMYIERTGNITPYILASEFVIHSNCTSGFDAFMYKKRTINYSDQEVEIPLQYDNSITRRFGKQVDTIDALRKSVRQYLSNLKGIEIDWHALDRELYIHKEPITELINSIKELSDDSPEVAKPNLVERFRLFSSWLWANVRAKQRPEQILEYIEGLSNYPIDNLRMKVKLELIGKRIVKISKR